MSGEIQELYFDRLGKTYTRLEYDNITYLMRLSVRCYCHFNQIWHVQFPSQEEFHNMLRIRKYLLINFNEKKRFFVFFLYAKQ